MAAAFIRIGRYFLNYFEHDCEYADKVHFARGTSI